MDKEKHFTKIPNELFEVLAKTRLSPYESGYIFALLRKTYGWGKDFDYIANSQFAKITDIPRPHIWRTEVKLLGRKIITCRGNKIGINRSFDQWRELPTEVIITRRGKSITYKGNKKLPAGVATKESKETIQKKEFLLVEDKLKISEAYKAGDRKFKPFYRNDEMIWKAAAQKWYVIVKGQWLEYADKEAVIDWR